MPVVKIGQGTLENFPLRCDKVLKILYLCGTMFRGTLN